jgi:3D (Asp-Asp-Asp) domain-containing protein
VRFIPTTLVCALLAGCAGRQLPPYEKPLAKTEFQTVRTTAYTHTEDDHRQYGRANALGTTLTACGVRSAAADWGRWPAGTVFQLLPSGPLFRVDDYGWALAGRNTIDLYMPTRHDMNCWGVRRVNIRVLQWGDPRASLAVLEPRRKFKHVKRIFGELRDYQEPAPMEPVAARAVPFGTTGG